MKVIVGDRQTGKTTQLIELCAEAEARGEISYIVCHSQHEAYRIAQKAKELDKNIAFPLTYSEFINANYAGQNIDNFYIDNVEFLIRSISRVPIAAITINIKKDDDDS